MSRVLAPGALLFFTACAFDAPHVDPSLEQEIKQAESQVAQNPSDAAALVRAAELYAKAGRTFDAADRFREALTHDPHNASAYVGISDVYNKLGYWMQSYQALDRCASMQTGNEECLLRIGMLLRSEGSPEGLREAKRVLGDFLAKAPDHPRAADVRRTIGQIEVQLASAGQPAEAASQPAGTADRGASPHGAPPPSPHAAAPGAGAAPGAAPPGIPEHEGADGEPVGQLNPFGVAIGKAFEAMRNSDAAGAEAALKEALVIRPQDVGAHAMLADMYLQQGKTDAALASAEKAYALDPKDPQSRWVLGLVLIRTGKDMGRGLEAWRALARDDPEYAEKLGVKKTLEEAEKFSKQGGAHPPAP